MVGKTIKEWRNGKIFITTKVHPLGDEFRNNNTIKNRYPIQYIKEQVEGSLKRLQVETIDLLQLHLWFEDGLSASYIGCNFQLSESLFI